MAKEGSTIGGLMDSFGTALSIALQYGVPLEVLVNKFSHTRFEPLGHTSNKEIRMAKSVVDYIARWLGLTFLSGHQDPLHGSGGESSGGPAGGGLGGSVNPGGSPGNGGEATALVRSVMEGLRVDAGAAVALAERATLLASLGDPNANGNGAGNGTGNGVAVSGDQLPADDDPDHLHGPEDQYSRFQSDAPSCDNCGSITVRNGNCYLCYNCGNSMGCS